MSAEPSFIDKVLHRARCLVRGAPQLTEAERFQQLCNRHPTDKWTVHQFGQPYLNHFSQYREDSVRLIEIGIGGFDGESYADPKRGGQSLRLWKDYFARGQIIGIDIEDKKQHAEDRITVLQGSQTDDDFLKSVVRDYGTPNIIIDDGSHVCSHVISTFNVLFPLLDANGLYVIEDTQTSFWPTDEKHQYGGNSTDLNDPQTIMGFVKKLIDGLNHAELVIPGYQPSAFDLSIVGVYCYHNIVFIQKGDNSAKSSMVRDGKLP